MQVKHRRQVAEVWLEKVMVDHMTRFDAWTAFNSTVRKTLEYPQLPLALTEAAYNTMMAQVLSGGLLNMGICRSMARALVYGPTKIQGLGINKLFTKYGILHLIEMIDHIWRKTWTRKLIQT